MSIFNKECDLYDEIMSDDKLNEMQCFEKFKRETNGIIYQEVPITVTYWNLDDVVAHCNGLKIISKKTEVPDKRTKSGKRTKTITTYEYYNQKFETLDALNNFGVYYLKEIHLTNILDLIPYYPYTTSSSGRSKDQFVVILSSRNPYDEMDKEYPGSSNRYRHNLQQHYIEVFEKYLNRRGRVISEPSCKVYTQEGRYFTRVAYSIDYNFEIDISRTLHTWIYTEPTVVDYEQGILDVTDVWPGEMYDGMELIVDYTRQ